MSFNQRADISTLIDSSLKLVDKFIYRGSTVHQPRQTSTRDKQRDGQLSIGYRSDLTDKIKRSFFQAAVVSTLLYGCTTWTLTKHMEKKLNGYYTRMLQAILKNPGGSTQQSSRCTAAYHPSRKLSKLDDPDMRDTAGEVRTVIIDILPRTSKGRVIYNNSVPIPDLALKIYRERWTIETGGGRGSGRSVLVAWHDDDDDDMPSNSSSAARSRFCSLPHNGWFNCCMLITCSCSIITTQ